MTHERRIDRRHPALIVFLVDQSGSMQENLAGSNRPKADQAADVMNRILQEFVLKAVKEEEIREYYDLAAIGYGSTVEACFGGDLAGRLQIPIQDIVQYPLRVETRKKKVSNGAGGLVEIEEEFPVWIEPKAEGPTPMRAALEEAARLIRAWTPLHRDSFPPLVINISDGEPTVVREGQLYVDDADKMLAAAQKITEQCTQDGNALLFNCHISRQMEQPIRFPHALTGSEDPNAHLLFRMSSELPEKMRRSAQAQELAVAPGARGFVYNAQIEDMVQLLDIGTQLVQQLTDAR